MASAKLLFALSAALLLSSAYAQNTTVNSTLLNTTAPVNATLPVNTTAPVITPVAVNATAANSTNASLPSNATLAIYRAVRSQGLALLGAISNGNIVGVSNYVSSDVQLVLPNTTAPVLLSNVTTLLPFFALLTPPAGSNVTVNNVSELYFYVIDSTNVLTVYEVTAGQLGNVYITGFWQLLNSTTSPNGTWTVAYASIAPAPSGSFIPQTLPVFAATPNVTINSTAGNVTATPLNTSIPTNLTIEATVVAVSNSLQGALSNASLSPANITSQYFAPFFQVVLPKLKSPTVLNLTDPTIVTFFNLLQGRNATGTAAAQTLVSYKQLNNQSVILTTLVPALPAIGDVYVIQLWQYLNASTGSNTTLGVNTTIPTNSSTTPLARTWQLTFASVNLAPNSAAAGPIAAGAPVPAPAPAPVQATSTEAPVATTANAPAATTSTAAGGPVFAPVPSST